MRILFRILLISLIFGCKNRTYISDSNETIDTLKYSYKGFNNGGSLYLMNNGNFIHTKFIYGCTGGGEIKQIFGEYKREKSDLILNEKRIELEKLSIGFNEKSEILKLNFVPDSLKLNNKFKIINWNNFEYLLSENITEGWSLRELNDFNRFSDNYNSGYEPENSGMYLRMKVDSINTNKKLNLNQIPIKWRNLFLQEPIKTKIVGFRKKTEIIDNEDYIYWLVKIDKGENQNIRKFLDFKRKNEYNIFTIDSVLSNKSYIKIYDHTFQDKMDLKVGEELRTKWN
ncbi:hypothetical protein PG913_08585 [Tenacibaculum pacificus]|uniref:hypothetical protein n=1 Tax=Tenacibaculum pacificus TaxID=3018314 RepID=UPI0022F3CABC|nr:hypothetical protein [Tenacibaculum pacificus]WBX72955.1 hypothetical protein PG913_08585 [Tenacibaculum pacificus]